MHVEDVIPIYVFKNTYFCEINDPQGLAFRFGLCNSGTIPSYGKILSSLRKSSPPSYMEKWNKLVPSIDWQLTIKQRRAPFIPFREKDVLSRIHCNALPTAHRLHSPHISPACDYCSPNAPTPIQMQADEVTHTHLSLSLHCAPPNETLQHLLFECPSSQQACNSLTRVLRTHFNISINHSVEMLFSLPSMPSHGFPFTLLLATTVRQIWLARCNRRFQRKRTHPKALLHLILHLFMIYCSSHFLSLHHANTNKSRNLLNRYKKAAKDSKVLLFTDRGTPYLHPLFKKTWLLSDHFDPP